MTEEAKSAESEKMLADAKEKEHKEAIASTVSSAVAAEPTATNQPHLTSACIVVSADEPGHLVTGPEAGAPSREQPDAPLSALKTSRKRHKHKRSSHKPPRGPDDKADAAGHAGAAHVKRRKSKVVDEGGFHLNKDQKPGQVPPARPPQTDVAKTASPKVRNPKPEGSVCEEQEVKPITVVRVDGAGTGTLGSHIADEARQEEFGHSAASATVETEHEADDGTVATVGGAGKTIWSSNATAQSEAADSAPLAATSVAGNGKVNGGSPVPTDTEVAAEAEVNADSAPPAHAEVGGSDAEVGRNVDADVDAALKRGGPEHGIDGKTGITLPHQTRRRSSAAVKIVAPESEFKQCGPSGSGASPATVRSSRGSKAARPGRVPCRKSDGDLRSLYSLVALKDLATTLRTDSPDRALQGTRANIDGDLEPRVTWLWLAIALAGAVTLLLWVSGVTKVGERTVCSSSACAQLSAVFEGVLNYSVDPCVDLDAFVCSGGNLGPRSLVAQLIKEYELTMVQLFLGGKTTFEASRVVSDFLHECTTTHDTPPSIDHFEDFFEFVSVPWPFDHSDRAEVHPLESVFTLSLQWGIDTWFRAYVHTADFSHTPVLFIEGAAQASSWLDFVLTLEKVGSREKYFGQFHDRYNASPPEPETIATRLATEKQVLSILDAARSPALSTRPVIASLAKVAAQVGNSTLDNWLDPVIVAPGGVAASDKTLVSVQDVRVLQAVDKLLSGYSEAALVEHLSWWLVQILTVVGWPQGYVIIAGSREAAAVQLKAECYRTMAGRFGLLLASESAVQFFTPDSRREIKVFLRGLLDFLRGVATKVPWLSDKSKATIVRRIQDLDVTLWPLKVDNSNETLWQLYSNFCVSCNQTDNTTSASASPSRTAADPWRPRLIDYWLDNSVKFWSLTDAQREDMQLLWQGDALEALRYEPWSNRLRVSHVALRSPFFHPASTELEHANFGGLGAAFLANALQMFVPPVADIGPDVPLETWPEISGVEDLASSLNCSAEFLPNLRDIVALGLAWHALKGTVNASSGDSSVRPSHISGLAIKDEKNVAHFYSGDQLFFLTYCRTRCARSRSRGGTRGPDCNEAVRSIADFGRTFNCAPGSPMAPTNTCYVSDFF